MKLFLLVIVLSISAVAQTFTATSTITLQRRSTVTQAAANQALQRDIERFVRAYAPEITKPVAKDAQGACLPFTATIEGKVINLEIYNRDASSCAVSILGNGKTDLRAQAGLDGVLERLIRALFNGTTDAQNTKEQLTAAEAAAKADNTAREAEKP